MRVDSWLLMLILYLPLRLASVPSLMLILRNMRLAVRLLGRQTDEWIASLIRDDLSVCGSYMQTGRLDAGVDM